MRLKIYAILLLALFGFILVKSILPYVDYYLHKEYIAKNLCEKKEEVNNCCHGKCYLEKEIKKNEESGDKRCKDNTNQKKTVSQPDVREYISTIVYEYNYDVKNRLKFVLCSSVHILHNRIFSIFVPPEM